MSGRGRLRRSHDQRERRLARRNHRNGRLRRKWLGRCDEVRRVGGEVGRVRVAAVAAAKETVCTHRRDADEQEGDEMDDEGGLPGFFDDEDGGINLEDYSGPLSE